MKSLRRRHIPSPKRLQLGKSYEERQAGGKRDAARKRNRTNILKARRLLQKRSPLSMGKNKKGEFE